MKKQAICILVLLLCANIGYSQKKLRDSNFAASVEFMSKYVWRGLEYGTAPVTAPMIVYGYKGFNVFVMGAYAFDGSHQEVDYGLSYTIKGFTLGVSDYYYPTEVGGYDHFFEYRPNKTNHSIEAYFTAAPFDLPFWITLSTYIYGADKGLNGQQAYSSYAEVGYTFRFKNDNNLSLCVGANLNKSFYTNYEEGFNVVNINVKYATAIPFGNFKLPVSASFILNTYKRKSFFTFSIYLSSKM